MGRKAPINPDNFLKALEHSKRPILDLGSGGVDLADTTVDIDGNADVLWNLDEFPYPFDDNSYKTCWMIHVLEHLKEPDKALSEMKRIAGERAIVILPVGWRNDLGHKRIYMPEDIKNFGADIVEYSQMAGLFDAVLVWEVKDAKCGRTS